MDWNPPAPLSMGFPRQEYWSGLPFPSPGDLPDPGIEPASPALAGRLFTSESPGRSNGYNIPLTNPLSHYISCSWLSPFDVGQLGLERWPTQSHLGLEINFRVAGQQVGAHFVNSSSTPQKCDLFLTQKVVFIMHNHFLVVNCLKLLTLVQIVLHAQSPQSCPALCDPMNCIVCQATLSMGFSRQKYWSELPCPSPGNLPNPGIEPWSPVLQVDSLLNFTQASPKSTH